MSELEKYTLFDDNMLTYTLYVRHVDINPLCQRWRQIPLVSVPCRRVPLAFHCLQSMAFNCLRSMAFYYCVRNPIRDETVELKLSSVKLKLRKCSLSSVQWSLSSSVWSLSSGVCSFRSDVWSLRSDVWSLRSGVWSLSSCMWSLSSQLKLPPFWA